MGTESRGDSGILASLMAQWLGVGYREKFNRFNDMELLLNDVARCHFCSLVNVSIHVFIVLRQCALRA